MSRNLAASIRARLKQRADAKQQDFDLTLTHYGLERLLYRLSISPHGSNYLLKGALLFSLWYDQPHRPTRDADLLGFGPDDIDSSVRAFQDICRIAVEDGVDFDARSVRGTAIRKDGGYGGVRIDLKAALDGARIALQVDIGFGDAVTPAAQDIRYPVLLHDMAAPQLRGYSKYSVIAEKLHALCLLGMANSRMKDYFDLSMLMAEDSLDSAELRRAIAATFERRRMALPNGIPTGLSDGFSGDAAKQTQWNAFLKRNRLAAMDLPNVVRQLRDEFQMRGVF